MFEGVWLTRPLSALMVGAKSELLCNSKKDGLCFLSDSTLVIIDHVPFVLIGWNLILIIVCDGSRNDTSPLLKRGRVSFLMID